jgi:hypothetical protein
MVSSFLVFLFYLLFLLGGWLASSGWFLGGHFGLMERSLPEDLHDGHYLLGLLVVESDVDDCPHEVLADLVVVELLRGKAFLGALSRRGKELFFNVLRECLRGVRDLSAEGMGWLRFLE